MALFALLCTDKPASGAIRAATRETHLAYLGQHAAQVKLAGPFLAAVDGAPTGSLVIIEAADQAAAEAFATADPYAQAGLFERVEVKPWRRVIGGFTATA